MEMSDSIYAPPQSDLGAIPVESINAPFYVVSVKKLAVLGVVTFGLYFVYWHYQNWREYRDWKRTHEQEETGIWPVPRGIFSIFFMHSLFRNVKEYGDNNGRRIDWEPGRLATILVILTIIGNLLDRAVMRNIGYPYTDILSLVLLAPLLYIYTRVQPIINASCGDPDSSSNSAFGGANWAWIVIGALLWVLVLAGIFIDPEQI
jgi:hypothetical protein